MGGNTNNRRGGRPPVGPARTKVDTPTEPALVRPGFPYSDDYTARALDAREAQGLPRHVQDMTALARIQRVIDADLRLAALSKSTDVYMVRAGRQSA